MPSKEKGNVKKAIPQKRQLPEIEKKKNALKAEKAKIEKQCAEEFQALLKKHNCTVTISGQFHGPEIKYGLHFVLNV